MGSLLVTGTLAALFTSAFAGLGGFLIFAKRHYSQENINFMATHAKGLICTPMSAELAAKLNFPQMVSENTDNHETAFTVSIDHVDTTTGISAAERAYTMMKCVDDTSRPEDFRRPGHVFPLVAKKAVYLCVTVTQRQRQIL